MSRKSIAVKSKSPIPPCEDLEFDVVEIEASDCEGLLCDALTKIIEDQTEELETLCGNFLAAGEDRYTVDEGSVVVHSVWHDRKTGWKTHLGFTVSVYWGCKDMDVCGDERDCVIPIDFDPVTCSIRLKAPKRIKRDTFEEF
jgi:hypothetical protein